MPAPSRRPEKLISLPDAAEQLGVSTRTVRRMIAEGRVKAYRYRTGGHLRLDPRDLDFAVKRVDRGEVSA